MGKFYAAITGVVILALGWLYTVIAAKRRGVASGDTKRRAKELIREVNEAVAEGDDAKIQDMLEEKIRHD